MSDEIIASAPATDDFIAGAEGLAKKGATDLR
jgi:hypothetical protein